MRSPRATRQVFIRICGKQHYLWRAVDQDGNALDILLQSRRSAAAAKRFFRKLLKGLRYVPRAPRQRHHAWDTHKMQAIVGAFFIDLINLTLLAFYRKPFSSLRKNRLVAVALRRLWTRTSRTFPS